jgi:competence protein ComGC
MSIVKELWSFMKVRKKFWLLPVLLVTLILGLVLILAPSAVAPFIYALF